MILEGIVTTVSDSGAVNLAPMGPEVPGANFDRFVLKPFATSQTYQNLKAHGEGVLHITDDVLLLAKAAVGRIDPMPTLISAQRVRGQIIQDVCRFCEFRVVRIDDSRERIQMDAEVVRWGRNRDFFGFNRAMFAVLEAAILATRTHFLAREQIVAEFARLQPLVEKTAGQREREAFEFLRNHLGI